MRDVNKVELTGRATQDSEVFEEKGLRTRIRMATNIPYRRQDGSTGVDTCFHSITFWNRRYDVKKGQAISVVGQVEITRGKDQKGVEHDYYGVRGKSLLLVADAEQFDEDARPAEAAQGSLPVGEDPGPSDSDAPAEG